MPFRNIPFRMETKYRAGTAYVTIRSGAGMFAMLKTKPESRNEGRKEVSIPSVLARSWFLVAAEINIPKLSPPMRKMAEVAKSKKILPRKGTPRRKALINTQRAVSAKPMSK